MNSAAPPDLHDIVLPEPVSLMPQTPAWWVLLALILVIAGWAAYRGLRRWHADRYRRAALARLQTIEQALADPASRVQALSSLPELMKQTALASWPRSEVASLSGNRWLHFLDSSFGGSEFTRGVGRLLPALAYEASPPATSEELRELVRLIRRWIREHSSTLSTSLTPSTLSEEADAGV